MKQASFSHKKTLQQEGVLFGLCCGFFIMQFLSNRSYLPLSGDEISREYTLTSSKEASGAGPCLFCLLFDCCDCCCPRLVDPPRGSIACSSPHNGIRKQPKTLPSPIVPLRRFVSTCYSCCRLQLVRLHLLLLLLLPPQLLLVLLLKW